MDELKLAVEIAALDGEVAEETDGLGFVKDDEALLEMLHRMISWSVPYEGSLLDGLTLRLTQPSTSGFHSHYICPIVDRS